MQIMVIAILKESNKEWIFWQTEDTSNIKLYSFSRFISLFFIIIIIIVFVIAIIIIIVIIIVIIIIITIIITTTIISIELSHFYFNQRICFILVVWC